VYFTNMSKNQKKNPELFCSPGFPYIFDDTITSY
jgi:hypothetical protein